MAMNKKELADFERLKNESQVNRALRWSDYCELKDVPPPSSQSTGMDRTQGYTFNAHNSVVTPMWSTSISHGTIGSKNGSQRGIALYSTRKKALMALRRELERLFAEKLAYVDNEIQKESSIEI
ncbi:TPA: hypothetical protein ACQQX6_004305 [Yersinia enterocolitica]|nr:hypothetical protein [Yersinia enterocolitica]HDZ9662514.1 hypothetical protein [Yersinia enterocolitica]HEM6603758.1 hypothetical protein [Yersinia enterocolitica]HEN3538686.1 hypothetical protein [Yersinia enterocolitica]